MIYGTLGIFSTYLLHMYPYNFYNMNVRMVKLVQVYYLNKLYIFFLK